MASRVMGKLAFARLMDESGSIQVMGDARNTNEKGRWLTSFSAQQQTSHSHSRCLKFEGIQISSLHCLNRLRIFTQYLVFLAASFWKLYVTTVILRIIVSF